MIAFNGTNGLRIARTPQIRAARNIAPQYLRENVRMLVRVQMRHFNPRRLNLPDLRDDFRDQLLAIKSSHRGARGEGGKAE